MDSNRMPGKALYKIDGKYVVEYPIQALKNNSEYEIILSTSDREVDKPLVEVAIKNEIKYYCGSIDNVAQRVCDTLSYYEIDIFARVNGDSPFVFPNLLLWGFKKIEEGFDFATNLYPRTFPYGVSVEIFKTEVFKDNFLRNFPDLRNELITTYFYNNISNFKVATLKNDISGSDRLRFTIDTIEDYERLTNFIIKNKGTFDTHNELISNYLEFDKTSNKK